MTLIEELSNQFVPIVVIVAFGWYISHFAKAIIPRLLLVTFGLYFAILGNTEFDHLIGLGLALPHIKFFFTWIVETVDEFKRGTLDIYYSFLTIFYKTRNIFIKAYRFFSGKKSRQKKSTGSSYYEKQEYRQYEDFGQSSENQNRREERQEQQKQEEDYSYQDNHSSYEEPKQEPEDDISDEYKQFFSTDPYIILGVNKSDECKSIHKKWRKLQRQYHPDLHMDEAGINKLYNEITARINGAHSTIKKQKAC